MYMCIFHYFIYYLLDFVTAIYVGLIFGFSFWIFVGTSLVAQMVKASVCNAGDLGLIPSWEDPWRRKWQPTPVLLPGKFHGQRSLVGYSPWDRRVGHN